MADEGPTTHRPTIGPDYQQFHATDQWYRTVRALFFYSAICFIVWQVQIAVSALAGRDTSVAFDFVLTALADVKFVVTIGWAGGATAWAVVERRLRHKSIERLHARIKFLEEQKDPKRTTSGLTTRGRTNPRDRET